MFAIIFVTLVASLLAYLLTSLRRPHNFPPGPQWHPIVGNFLQLRAKVRKYGKPLNVYEHWMKKYNSPVIGMKMGSQYTVVVLGYSELMEVYKRPEFEGRPDGFLQRIRIGIESGERIGITSADGPKWHEQRSFVARHLKLLEFGREKMEEKIQNELEDLLTIFDESEAKPIYPGEHLPSSVLNVLWTFIAGATLSREKTRVNRIMDLLRGCDAALNLSIGVLMIMPNLRYLGPGWKSYILLKKFNKEIRDFMQEVIDEHKATYSEDKAEDDLIYSYIREMKMQSEDSTNFNDSQLIAVVLDLFIAGAVTTSSTINFLLIALATNAKVQEKCHQVIDDVLRNTAFPKLSDKSSLSYIEAVILETERIRNVVEVNGPRRTVKATTIGGYYIPKDTTILLATQHVMKDEAYWGDPHVFRPERFLDENGRITNTERILVFGKGSRRCLGEALARACIFTYLTGILQKYQIEAPEDEDVSLEKCDYGFTTSPKPYKVVFKRR